MSTGNGYPGFEEWMESAWDIALRKPKVERIQPVWAEGLAPFRYQPINVDSGELRIVTLLQGSKDDVLRCKIQHMLPGGNGEDSNYTALSYTWGKPKANKPIMIDDCLHYVTDNLENALINLRKEHEDFTFWIDAICINQADIDERNRHVKVMKQVYQKAETVLIWLGPSGADSHLAMQTIRALEEVRQYWDRRRELQTQPPWMQQQTLLRLNMMYQPRMSSVLQSQFHALCVIKEDEKPTKAFADRVRAALRALFEREWWKRMWVVQEATTPNFRAVIVCGEESAPMEAFVGFQTLWYQLNENRSYAVESRNLQLWVFNRLLTIRNWRSMEPTTPQAQQYLRILSLVKYFERSISTDGRDKIYALIGLANDVDEKAYNVDYNMRPTGACTYLTRYLMEKHGNLDVLGCCYQPSPISWSPHWIWGYTPLTPFAKAAVRPTALERRITFETSSGMEILLHNIEHHSALGPAYNASKGSTMHITFHDEENLYKTSKPSVSIRGFVLDVIKEPPLGSGALKSHWHRWESLEGEKRWERIIMGENNNKNNSKKYHTGETMLEAFRRTLVADILKYSDHLYRRGATMVWSTDEIVSHDADEHTCREYVSGQAPHCKDMTRGRGIFTTEKGYMGLTALGAGIGDLICVLFGGQVLYVLQKKDDHYTFMGECYIHGMMDGEAMAEFESGGVGVQDFVLK